MALEQDVVNLFLEKVFIYDAMVISYGAMLDQKFSMFLDLLFQVKKATRSQTIVYIPDNCFKSLMDNINRVDNKDYDRCEAAYRVLKNHDNDLIQATFGDRDASLAMEQLVGILTNNGKRVLVLCRSLTEYNRLMGTDQMNVNRRVSIMKLHSFIANDIREIHRFTDDDLSKNHNIIKIRNEIKEGDTVYDSNGNSITLNKTIGAGNEASVYSGSNGYVCKIFHKEKNTVEKFNKILRMIKLKRDYRDENIAWPLDIIKDRDGQFIGYYMKAINNALPLKYISIDASDRKKYLQNKVNLIRLCENLCHLFTTLHANYIAFGDISFSNILFDTKFNAYLVDLDSVQIDDFKCALKTLDFVAPEYISFNEKLQSFDSLMTFRSEQSELFLLGRLLFQILTGIDPYNCPENYFIVSAIENNYKGFFPYPLSSHAEGGDYSRLVAQYSNNSNIYFYDWLPPEIRKGFYNLFSKDNGRNYLPGKRIEALTWQKYFETYRHQLESLPSNSEAINLFPTHFADGGVVKHSKSTVEPPLKQEKITNYNNATIQPSKPQKPTNNSSLKKIEKVDKYNINNKLYPHLAGLNCSTVEKGKRSLELKLLTKLNECLGLKDKKNIKYQSVKDAFMNKYNPLIARVSSYQELNKLAGEAFNELEAIKKRVNSVVKVDVFANNKKKAKDNKSIKAPQPSNDLELEKAKKELIYYINGRHGKLIGVYGKILTKDDQRDIKDGLQEFIYDVKAARTINRVNQLRKEVDKVFARAIDEFRRAVDTYGLPKNHTKKARAEVLINKAVEKYNKKCGAVLGRFKYRDEFEDLKDLKQAFAEGDYEYVIDFAPDYIDDLDNI